MITIAIAQRGIAIPLLALIVMGGVYAYRDTTFSMLLCASGGCTQHTGSDRRVIATYSPRTQSLVRIHSGPFGVGRDEAKWARQLQAYLVRPQGRLNLSYMSVGALFWWFVFTCWAIGAIARAGTTFKVDSRRGTLEIEERGFSVSRKRLLVEQMRSVSYEAQAQLDGPDWHWLVVEFKDGTRRRVYGYSRRDSIAERLERAINYAIAAQAPA